MKLMNKKFKKIQVNNLTAHYKCKYHTNLYPPCHIIKKKTYICKQNYLQYSYQKYKQSHKPASSLSSFFSLAPPASMLNMTILGVIVDIWLPKQNLYVPSMWATNVYLPFDSFAPLYTLLPSGPVTCVEVVIFFLLIFWLRLLPQ